MARFMSVWRWISNHSLHMWLQRFQNGIIKITEQTLQLHKNTNWNTITEWTMQLKIRFHANHHLDIILRQHNSSTSILNRHGNTWSHMVAYWSNWYICDRKSQKLTLGNYLPSVKKALVWLVTICHCEAYAFGKNEQQCIQAWKTNGLGIYHKSHVQHLE